MLAAANEYGAMAAAKILGVEILNEGSGISIDDAVSESSATFVARGIEPLAAVNSPFQGVIGGESLPTRLGLFLLRDPTYAHARGRAALLAAADPC